jgi:hypothetical protein
MKTLFIITLVLLGFILLSCNKVHECNCTETVTSNDPNTTPVVTQSTISTQEMSLKDAQTYCNGQDSEVYNGSSTTKKDCNVKN